MIRFFADQECWHTQLHGHNGSEEWRRGWVELLPRPGWEPGVCLHQASASDVRRQLHGRHSARPPRQTCQMSWNGRKPGMELQLRGKQGSHWFRSMEPKHESNPSMPQRPTKTYHLYFLFQDRVIRHMNTNKCLATQRDKPSTPILVDCNPDSVYQQWTMASKFKWQAGGDEPPNDSEDM